MQLHSHSLTSPQGQQSVDFQEHDNSHCVHHGRDMSVPDGQKKTMADGILLGSIKN